MFPEGDPHTPEGGQGTALLRGELGVERVMKREMMAKVGGYDLKTNFPNTRPVVGLGAAWLANDFAVRASLRAEGITSADRVYTEFLELQKKF